MAEREMFPSNSNRTRYDGDGTGIVPSTSAQGIPASNDIPSVQTVAKVKTKGQFGRKLIKLFFDQDIYNENPRKFIVREVVEPGFRDAFWTFVQTMLNKYGISIPNPAKAKTNYPYYQVSQLSQVRPNPITTPIVNPTPKNDILQRQVRALNLEAGVEFETEAEADAVIAAIQAHFAVHHMVSLGFLAQTIQGLMDPNWAQQDALGFVTLNGLYKQYVRRRGWVVFFPQLVMF